MFGNSMNSGAVDGATKSENVSVTSDAVTRVSHSVLLSRFLRHLRISHFARAVIA